MISDPILRWLKDSRNAIVKEGDLKTNSKIRVSFIESWNDSPSMEFEVSLFTKTEGIAREIAMQKPNEIKLDVGLLKVERKWVDSNLPNYELLEATAHCFNFLHKLIIDAHVPIAILLYPNGHANIFGLQMQNRAEKHLMYRKLATDIEKSGANGIIVIAESWVLKLDKDKKSTHPNRQEALVLTAANSNGEVYPHAVIFTKDKNGKITFGEESIDFSKESSVFLTPIMSVWKKQKS